MVFGFEIRWNLSRLDGDESVIGGWENETWAFLTSHKRHILDTQPEQQDEDTHLVFLGAIMTLLADARCQERKWRQESHRGYIPRYSRLGLAIASSKRREKKIWGWECPKWGGERRAAPTSVLGCSPSSSWGRCGLFSLNSLQWDGTNCGTLYCSPSRIRTA